MSTSNICLWMTLALCVAMGGCGNIYAQKGMEVEMDCGDADPNNMFDWKHNAALITRVGKSGIPAKGTTDLSQRVKLSGTKLRIPSVQTSDTGVYICTGYKKKTMRITREHRLLIVAASVSPSGTVNICSEVTLMCDIPDVSTAQWMKPPGNEPYESPGNKVTLKSVSQADAGRWICQIKENEEVVYTIQVFLYVEDSSPGPLKSLNEVTAPPGGAVELPCFLPSPSPLDVVKGGWKRDPHTDLQFPTLRRDDSGLHWTGTQSRIEFSTKNLSTDFTVKLNDVQPSDAGVYVCTLGFECGQSLNATLNLKVVSGAKVPPGSAAVSPGRSVITAPLGGAVDLPCVHSGSGGLRVAGGKWLYNPPSDIRLATLITTGDSPRWNSTDPFRSRVTFRDQQLSTNFTVTLNNVEQADAGVYVCSLVFNDGSKWSSELELKIEGEEAIVAQGVRPPPEKGFWEKPFYLGLALWIWVAVAAGALLLVVLVMVTVLVHCQSKRKRRKAEKNKIHMPPSLESVPMQSEFPPKGRQTHPRMKDRPLPPVPKHQYKQII